MYGEVNTDEHFKLSYGVFNYARLNTLKNNAISIPRLGPCHRFCCMVLHFRVLPPWYFFAKVLVPLEGKYSCCLSAAWHTTFRIVQQNKRLIDNSTTICKHVYHFKIHVMAMSHAVTYQEGGVTQNTALSIIPGYWEIVLQWKNINTV